MKDECKFDQWSVREISQSWSQSGSKKRILDLPQYQRSIVWRTDQRQEFIRSLKNGFPVGSILLFRKGYNTKEGQKDIERFSLIDGLQRLSTIKKYLENPCDFFDIEDLDKKTINVTKGCLYLDNTEEGDRQLMELVKEWIRSLDGFGLEHGYSGHYLCDFLKNKLSEEIEGKIIDNEKLIKYLYLLLDQIKKEANIDDVIIPITIYAGPEDNLPGIFEKINSKGTKLNRYEIYSASWVQYGSMKIENKEIAIFINKKYEKAIDEGWEVDNYDGKIENCTYFEYIFGFGKYISEKYNHLFDNSEKSDKADSCGFNLLAACLAGGIRKENLEKLPALIKNYYESDKLRVLENNILNSIKDVSEKLYPIISIKTSRKNSDTETIKIAHSESQIISLIAKMFKLKYKQDGLEEKNEIKHKEKINKFKENIEFYYLFDIITDSWRGSGDSRLAELLKDGSAYEDPINRDRWDAALNNLFDKQSYKKERKRVNIKFSETLLLNYIYSKYLNIHELGNKNFHMDHIIPVGDLSQLVEKDNLDGLPIGHIANLCLLSDKINNEKRKKAAIDYYNEVTKEGRNDVVSELDKQLLLKFSDDNIIYFTEGSITKDKYLQFLKSRFNILKKIFYLNFNIQ